MKKILIFFAIIIAILSLYDTITVNAQIENGNRSFSTIIQKLVERFDLNAEEVQKVFNEVREEKIQEMQAHFEKRWSDKIPEFNPSEFTTLTDEQKEALSVKRKELREKYEGLKDFSLEERQEKIQEIKKEMESWAEEQEINPRFIMNKDRLYLKELHKSFDTGFRPKFFNRE